MSMREERTRITQVSRIADKRVGGVACLVQIYGKSGSSNIGRKTALDKTQTTIGRGPDNDIVCDMDNVSRTHCRVYSGRTGDMIEDMGSTNGTFVNDIEIAGTHKLSHGDLVKIGGIIFKYISGSNIEQLYYEEIYRMAIIDGLTSIYNKRYFVEFVEREMARCRRYDRPLTLIMFDLDHFKSINDEHGHLAGDYVLRRLATLIAETNIRKEECFARYGGEEFAIVLPDTAPERGVILAEKIRAAIEAEVFKFEGNVIPVTISMGVAHFDASYEEPSAFIAAADEKLYAAKREGRNRVCA